jgi:hypothetical protein
MHNHVHIHIPARDAIHPSIHPSKMMMMTMITTTTTTTATIITLQYKPAASVVSALTVAFLAYSLIVGYYAGTRPKGEWRYFSWHPFLMICGLVGCTGVATITKKLGGYTNTKVRETTTHSKREFERERNSETCCHFVGIPITPSVIWLRGGGVGMD